MINGILNIYKEKGYTSHDVVARLRGIVGQKKIGHTGTLDPDAEGVLPVCLGRATKVCDLLTDKDKTYETVLLLGKTTDTQDITGTVLSERSPDGVTEDEVLDCIRHFIGEYDQTPPMYSALKVNGKKLCDLARAGKEVERSSRRVKIYSIQIEEMDLPRVKLRVNCSRGAYIRTLCHDIGQRLGCGGTMESLIRIRSGQFVLEEAKTLSEFQKMADAGELEEALIPVDSLFGDLPKAAVRPEWIRLADNGNPLQEDALETDAPFGEGTRPDGERIRIYGQGGRFYGIYAWKEESGHFKPVKLFLGKDS